MSTPATEQDRLNWEVLKLQYECRPLYKNLDRIGGLVITVIAIAAFFYQRQQSNLEYQMAAIQAAKAQFDADVAQKQKQEAEKETKEAEQSRDAYNASIADLQAKLKDLQKTYQEMVALTSKVTAAAATLPHQDPATTELRKDLGALNTQQKTLTGQWTRQTEQVQMLRPLTKK